MTGDRACCPDLRLINSGLNKRGEILLTIFQEHFPIKYHWKDMKCNFEDQIDTSNSVQVVRWCCQASAVGWNLRRRMASIRYKELWVCNKNVHTELLECFRTVLLWLFSSSVMHMIVSCYIIYASYRILPHNNVDSWFTDTEDWHCFRSFYTNADTIYHHVAVLDDQKSTKCYHYCDVLICAPVSQITNLAIVYSTVYSGADQRKHQSSA